ncbi:uncharacterized protein LOC143886662 [Tasmannia lanceolata]|uniref:uncharacterized protein LOC143886662 n=1 Tax=Tasmannia lanceolata TaxID=3420 RepID=UPI0040643500
MPHFFLRSHSLLHKFEKRSAEFSGICNGTLFCTLRPLSHPLMAISHRNILLHSKSPFSFLQTLIFDLQRLKHTFAGETESVSLHGAIVSDSASSIGRFDTSTWKTVDSRIVGIKNWMISSPIWTVLKVLKEKGFATYLVGGCVRDLILSKTPKDYDVVTTASLKQIKKQFRRALIVGRRFPICHVKIKDVVIEVSSFETTDQHIKEKEQVLCQLPISCDNEDFIRWKNSMKRDFTINSLFYDPSMNKIYDYADGMRDLKKAKLQTVIPAHLSFKEDCARILRGLRIAARLGLAFSKETATAIQDLSSSIMNLDKSRLMMELNFMLAYGAAERSLRVLQNFKVLEIMLPIHAAYLVEQAKNQRAQSSNMLMKLFSSMDKLLAPDRPCDCGLWVGLLSFHLALVNHPQEALVVWTFASILFHGNWVKAVEFARENSQMCVPFIPEISEASGIESDESLQEAVFYLASLVKSSIHALTSTDILLESMSKYPLSTCSGLVFISNQKGKFVSELFDVFTTDMHSYDLKRESYNIDCKLLSKGNKNETRFVLGKVIMDMMSSMCILEQNKNGAVKEGKPEQKHEAVKEEKAEQKWETVGEKHEQEHEQNKKEEADEVEKQEQKPRGEAIEEEKQEQKQNLEAVIEAKQEQNAKTKAGGSRGGEARTRTKMGGRRGGETATKPGGHGGGKIKTKKGGSPEGETTISTKTGGSQGREKITEKGDNEGKLTRMEKHKAVKDEKGHRSLSSLFR